MINKKKTMYEILEIQPDASYPEITAAHQRLSEKLHSEKNEKNGEDIDFRLKLINVAFHTLSVPASRDSYDAKISVLNPPLTLSEQPSSNVVALKPNVDALYLRSDAASLRADAASLRADAILLRADAMSLKIVNKPIEKSDDSIFSMIRSAFSNLASPLKKILLILGTMAAMGMVLQVVFLLFANRQANHPNGEAAKAEEKLYLQQYYQEHGVRPASRIEADLLDAENRRIDAENRRNENDQRTEEREKKRLDEEMSRLAAESRRRGEQISENLRRDEERLRAEEERKQEKLEREKRRAEMDELNRIEREKARWRSNSYQPSSYNRYEDSNE